MRPPLLACSTLILLQSCAKMPEKPQESVQWGGRILREVTTLSALPASLQAALGVGRPGLDGIADRGGRYNSTDVLDSNLPRRRFLVAGLDRDVALVAVERGGWGWNVQVRLFSKDVVQRQWTLFESPRTLRDLVGRLSP